MAGLQFPPIDSMAKAAIKGIIFHRHRYRSEEGIGSDLLTAPPCKVVGAGKAPFFGKGWGASSSLASRHLSSEPG